MSKETTQARTRKSAAASSTNTTHTSAASTAAAKKTTRSRKSAASAAKKKSAARKTAAKKTTSRAASSAAKKTTAKTTSTAKTASTSRKPAAKTASSAKKQPAKKSASAAKTEAVPEYVKTVQAPQPIHVHAEAAAEKEPLEYVKTIQPPQPAHIHAEGRLSVREEAGKPAVHEAPGKPAVHETPGKPAVREEAGKPSLREEPAKPAVREEAGKPAVREEPGKPAVKEEAGKPAVQESPCGTDRAAKREDAVRVLFVTPECVPFASSGGLGEVAGSLPKQLAGRDDIDCRVIMPLYDSIGWQWRSQMKYLGNKFIPVAWRSKYMGVFSLEKDGVTYYFIDNEEYFKRGGLYGYFDDCERYTFFSRAVFEALPIIGFDPQIIHANDWQSALVPVYQDTIYHRNLRTIFSIHNVEYQGRYGTDVIRDVLGLPEGSEHLVEYMGDANLMKGAIETANLVSTVSPTYAQELKDPFFSFGLDPIIRRNEGKLRGILNGIDTQVYNPAIDPIIPAAYNAQNLSGKRACKKQLQEDFSLPVKDVPLITLISRLVPAKGIDLITRMMDDILWNSEAQFVLLGTGEHGYEEWFRGLQHRHPDQVRTLIQFDRDLSHKLYAAGDILLMPSRSEPCGLSQMIGCLYGDIPVVRRTGGLNDSIKDCTLGDGSGFVFDDFNADHFRSAVQNAIDRWYDRENWQKLVAHDLDLDFSWRRSAQAYRDLYTEVAHW